MVIQLTSLCINIFNNIKIKLEIRMHTIMVINNSKISICINRFYLFIVNENVVKLGIYFIFKIIYILRKKFTHSDKITMSYLNISV